MAEYSKWTGNNIIPTFNACNNYLGSLKCEEIFFSGECITLIFNSVKLFQLITGNPCITAREAFIQVLSKIEKLQLAFVPFIHLKEFTNPIRLLLNFFAK